MTRVMHSCPHCGSMLTKARSPNDHRRFFAAIRQAFMHWPEGEFTPASEEHLRAWLLIQAGYSDVAYASTIQEAIREAAGEGNYPFAQRVGDQIEITTAKSISFSTLDQKAFGQIREKVEEIIEANIGVPVEQLLKEQAA
jgi:hypothetical protein